MGGSAASDNGSMIPGIFKARDPMPDGMPELRGLDYHEPQIERRHGLHRGAP